MFDFDNSLGFLLNRSAAGMKRRLDERLAAYDLTAGQWAVLARLWNENGLPLSEIGEKLFFDRPTMTGIVDRLVKKKLVRKVRSREDRRKIGVFLTEEGIALQEKLPQLATETNIEAEKSLSKEDVKELKRMLNTVWGNMK